MLSGYQLNAFGCTNNYIHPCFLDKKSKQSVILIRAAMFTLCLQLEGAENNKLRKNAIIGGKIMVWQYLNNKKFHLCTLHNMLTPHSQ